MYLEQEKDVTVHFKVPDNQIHIVYKPILDLKEAAECAGVSVVTFKKDHLMDPRLRETSAFLEGNRWKFETEPLFEYLHLRACEIRVKKGLSR